MTNGLGIIDLPLRDSNPDMLLQRQLAEQAIIETRFSKVLICIDLGACENQPLPCSAITGIIRSNLSSLVHSRKNHAMTLTEYRHGANARPCLCAGDSTHAHTVRTCSRPVVLDHHRCSLAPSQRIHRSRCGSDTSVSAVAVQHRQISKAATCRI